MQHERENFSLDVVEVRTNAPPPSVASGAGGMTGPDDQDVLSGQDTENCTSSHATMDDDECKSGGGCGRRVSVVSLLGDLDLEVEFCSSEIPACSDVAVALPDSNGYVEDKLRDHGPVREGVGRREERAAQFRSLPPPTTLSGDGETVVERASQSESSEARLASHLPEPAKAKKDNGVPLASEGQHQQRTLCKVWGYLPLWCLFSSKKKTMYVVCSQCFHEDVRKQNTGEIKISHDDSIR